MACYGQTAYRCTGQIWDQLGSNNKECSNYHTTAFISHASKVMLKTQVRLKYMTGNFQMYKLDLEKAEEPEVKLPASAGS